MNKRSFLTALALIALVSTSFATDSTSPFTGPVDLYGQEPGSGSSIDAFGDIMGTIPCAPPGANNVWEGEAWANGELILFKNIGPFPYSSPPQFYRINPQTGAVIAIVNLPFTGYVIDGCFDGTNLWIVQWSPVSVIHCVSLAGAEISSFPGNLGGWKAACVAWDGAYLWAGMNAEWYNTRLHKYSTTGTLLLNWTSGTAVGWYLGSEISTQAPVGSNLYVVDDAGHTIKRLNFGTTIPTVVEQTPSPATSPDQPTGLTFDGEYLWHGGAYALQGLLWKMDDGITTPVPNLSVTLAPINPPIIIPAIGGSFNYNAAIANSGSSPANFDVWIMVQLPNLTWYGPALGPVALTLASGGSILRQRTQSVPATAPTGSYWYEARVGTYPSSVIDTSGFAFTKSAVGNGLLVGDWNNSGEDFDHGTTAQGTIPAEFALHGAYPNPFNPATTLSYELPEAGFVKLEVYNITGQLAAKLANGWREAGVHEVAFDGSNLTSGIYLARLTTGDYTAMQKLVLMK